MKKRCFGVTLFVVCMGLLGSEGAEADDLVLRCQLDKVQAARMREECLVTDKTLELRELPFDTAECEAQFDADLAKADAQAVKKGTACRYVDNGDGTISNLDNLMMWEKKTDDGSVHDKDNTYTWSALFGAAGPEGAAFTDFLGELNDCEANSADGSMRGGFAAHCDWRLPTKEELEAILLEPFPCSKSPCIDPIFGPTTASNYWSSTSSANFPGFAWGVNFFSGKGVLVLLNESIHARAVRGGRGSW